MSVLKPPLLGVYLAHFGVKGMKWGVRRDLEKKAKTAYDAYAQVGQRGIDFSHREITKAEYDSLSSKPVRISDKNGTFKRVVKDNSGALRDGLVYVTKDGQDHTNYVALFPPEGNRANSQKFSATVSVDKAIVSPALKERVDTFVATLGTKVVVPGSSQVMLGREFIQGGVKRAHEDPSIRVLSDRELGLKYYQRWVQGQHQNDAFNQAYVSKLQKKGYNALIDDADTGMLSQMPIILFPRQSGARITEVTPITADDELIARTQIRAPEQRTV